MAPSPQEVTQLLHAWSQGDQQAFDQLAPLVYHELRRIAGRLLKNERPDHILQTTALVHEAFIRLIQQDQTDGWNCRAQFTAVAAQFMRQILVDYARRHTSAKRGSGQAPVSLDETVLRAPQRPDALIDLDEAMQEFAKISPDGCRVLELHYFGGMTQEEIADVQRVHVNTVARQLRAAQAWLQRRLQG